MTAFLTGFTFAVIIVCYVILYSLLRMAHDQDLKMERDYKQYLNERENNE